MFRIECYCKDQHVGIILRAMVGMTIGEPKVRPVANATAENGKVRAITDGSAVAMLAKHMVDNKLDKVKLADVRHWLPQAGRSPKSASTVIEQAKSAGVLKKRGTGRGSYYYLAKQPEA